MSGETETHIYACTRCGNCCRWPGIVKLSDPEIDRMAAYLQLTPAAFVAQYTKLRPDRQGLTLEEHADGSCIFLEGQNHCRVNPAKPTQCSGFPNDWHPIGFEAECPAIKLRVRTRRLPAAPSGEG